MPSIKRQFITFIPCSCFQGMFVCYLPKSRLVFDYLLLTTYLPSDLLNWLCLPAVAECSLTNLPVVCTVSEFKSCFLLPATVWWTTLYFMKVVVTTWLYCIALQHLAVSIETVLPKNNYYCLVVLANDNQKIYILSCSGDKITQHNHDSCPTENKEEIEPWLNDDGSIFVSDITMDLSGMRVEMLP